MSQKLDYETTLTPEILEKAEKELGEDEHRRTESVLALREWVKKQPHLQAMPLGIQKIANILSLTKKWFTYPTHLKTPNSC
jgi:hypothetical protein